MALKRGEKPPVVAGVSRDAATAPAGPAGNDERSEPPAYAAAANGAAETELASAAGSHRPFAPDDAPSERSATNVGNAPSARDTPPAAMVADANRSEASLLVRYWDWEADRPASITDPISGWLVVWRGAARGNALTVGYGETFLRMVDNRFELLADAAEPHANALLAIAYDPAAKNHSVRAIKPDAVERRASNATAAQPVMTTAAVLQHGDRLVVDGGELVFIAFCDGDRHWEGDAVVVEIERMTQ